MNPLPSCMRFMNISHIATNTERLNIHFLPSVLKQQIKVLKNYSKQAVFTSTLYKPKHVCTNIHLKTLTLTFLGKFYFAQKKKKK